MTRNEAVRRIKNVGQMPHQGPEELMIDQLAALGVLNLDYDASLWGEALDLFADRERTEEIFRRLDRAGYRLEKVT